MDKKINIHWKEFGTFLKGTKTRVTTKKQYVHYFKKFDYDSFTYNNLLDFLNKYQTPLAKAMLSNLKEFILINYKDLGLTKEDKADISDIKIPTLSSEIVKLPRHFKHDQIIKAIEKLPTEKYRLMGYISYYGSLRVGELMKLRVMSLNIDEFNEQRIFENHLQGEIKTIGKSDREGIAIIPYWLMKKISFYIIEEKLRFNDFLFLDELKKENSNIREWQRVLLDAGINSGITVLNLDGTPTKETRLTPHKLRHSFAVHLLLDERKNIRVIQEALRHKSIRSTEIYTQLDKSELKKELLDVK